jgi:hypothetical protein
MSTRQIFNEFNVITCRRLQLGRQWLSFRAGKIPMQSDEWFMSEQIIAVFLAFLNGEKFPEYVHWRDAPGF